MFGELPLLNIFPLDLPGTSSLFPFDLISEQITPSDVITIPRHHFFANRFISTAVPCFFPSSCFHPFPIKSSSSENFSRCEYVCVGIAFNESFIYTQLRFAIKSWWIPPTFHTSDISRDSKNLLIGCRSFVSPLSFLCFMLQKYANNREDTNKWKMRRGGRHSGSVRRRKPRNLRRCVSGRQLFLAQVHCHPEVVSSLGYLFSLFSFRWFWNILRFSARQTYFFPFWQYSRRKNIFGSLLSGRKWPSRQHLSVTTFFLFLSFIKKFSYKRHELFCYWSNNSVFMISTSFFWSIQFVSFWIFSSLLSICAWFLLFLNFHPLLTPHDLLFFQLTSSRNSEFCLPYPSISG